MIDGLVIFADRCLPNQVRACVAIYLTLLLAEVLRQALWRILEASRLCNRSVTTIIYSNGNCVLLQAQHSLHTPLKSPSLKKPLTTTR